jgi:hypothetical protein
MLLAWEGLGDEVPLREVTEDSSSVVEVLIVSCCCCAPRSRPRLPLRDLSVFREAGVDDAPFLMRRLEVLERVRGAKYSSPV